MIIFVAGKILMVDFWIYYHEFLLCTSVFPWCIPTKSFILLIEQCTLDIFFMYFFILMRTLLVPAPSLYSEFTIVIVTLKISCIMDTILWSYTHHFDFVCARPIMPPFLEATNS